MQDRLRQLLERVQEWWNKFTARQKTLIISVAAGVILALAILVTVPSPQSTMNSLPRISTTCDDV